MSEIFVVRQPVFDKRMNLYGYELLYRQSPNVNLDSIDDDLITESLVDNFLVTEFSDLVGSGRGFVNFNEKLLLDEVPLMLPNDQIVVEILERVQINYDVLAACQELKAKDYIIALDDYVLDDADKYKDIIKLVDIIKIEYYEDTVSKQMRSLKRYNNKLHFLAKGIDTREEFKTASRLGYNLFQGNFYGKPVAENAGAVGTISTNVVTILVELRRSEPNFNIIAEIFERDVDLAYKLLKLINSSYYGSMFKIESIHQALVRLGTKELSRWVSLVLVKGVQNIENAELIKTSLIRGRMLSLIAKHVNNNSDELDYFLTGIFSSMDVLLNKDMSDIVKELPLNDEVNQALLGKENHIRKALDAIICFEEAQFSWLDIYVANIGMSHSEFMSIYMDAVKWEKALKE